MNKTSEKPTIHMLQPVILGVMAKYWEPGTVKTRLGKSIGPAKSAQLHRAFCLHLASTLKDTADHRHFCVTPVESAFRFEDELSQDWYVCDQASGNLGNRIQSWFEDQFDDRKNASAILIGADCPTLTPSLINDAAEKLRNHDLVLGPAADGGYYLIGLNAPWKSHYARLLDDIPWSSDQVFCETSLRASEIGLSLAVLPQQEDIDTIDELNRLRESLKNKRDNVSQSLDRQIETILERQ